MNVFKGGEGISGRFNAQPLLGIESGHLHLERELAGAGTNRDGERRRTGAPLHQIVAGGRPSREKLESRR